VVRSRHDAGTAPKARGAGRGARGDREGVVVGGEEGREVGRSRVGVVAADGVQHLSAPSRTSRARHARVTGASRGLHGGFTGASRGLHGARFRARSPWLRVSLERCAGGGLRGAHVDSELDKHVGRDLLGVLALLRPAQPPRALSHHSLKTAEQRAPSPSPRAAPLAARGAERVQRIRYSALWCSPS
jgi:hypothetical protein